MGRPNSRGGGAQGSGGSRQGRPAEHYNEEESESNSQDRQSAEEPLTVTEEGGSRRSEAPRGGSNAPPPTYDGTRAGTVFENYRIKAYLWLEHTGLRPTARGPRLLQELTDTTFQAAKHFALDQSWREDPENGQ